MATQTPKPQQPKKTGIQPAADQHAAKKKGKMSGGAFVSIALVVLMIVACAAVYFNLVGAKEAVAGVLGLTTVETAVEEEAARLVEIETREAQLASEEAALKEKEKGLDTREKELIARETAVTDEENDATQAAQAATELTAAAEIFAQMDAESAAKAIAGMKSVDEMVRILTSMPSDQAALVMDKMDSKLASDILSAMMK